MHTKYAASISTRCSLKIRKTHSVSIPSQIAPNVWILTTPPSAVTTAHHTHLPRRNIKIYYNKEANSHLATTPNLQCYITQLPSTPHYENSASEVNISLDMANRNMINISSWDFHICQHLVKHQNESQLQHLANIPSVPVDQLYRHMANGIQHITPFTSPEESTGDTTSIWTLFSHTGVYVMTIRLLLPARLVIFCCYFFWC